MAFGTFSSIVIAAAVAHEFTDEMHTLLNPVMSVFQADQGLPSLTLHNISHLKLQSTEATNKDCQGTRLGVDLWSASTDYPNLLARCPPSLRGPNSIDILHITEKKNHLPLIRALEGASDNLRSANKSTNRKMKDIARTVISHLMKRQLCKRWNF